MSATLPSLLELAHRAVERWQPLTGEFRDERTPLTGGVVVSVPRDGPPSIHAESDGLLGTPIVSQRRIAFLPPDRLRVEVWTDDRPTHVSVRNRTRWWQWDEHRGIRQGTAAWTSDGSTIPPILRPPLLDPALLLASLRITPVGMGMRAGRTVIRANGTPRDASRGPLTFELELDAEYGLLLHRRVLRAGRYLDSMEALEVSFGAAIDTEIFEIADANSLRPRGHSPH